MEINIGETHIRLTTDLDNHDLTDYIYDIRTDLKTYINHNQEFLHSMTPMNMDDDNLPEIVRMMHESALKCDVGPMACVAGTVSELSLKYLMRYGSKNSIVENGGDISLINTRTVLCGIYSDNPVLGNEIAFKIKQRNRPLGICTSSGKIGHSISFGSSDSVTVLADSTSIADGLATRIANDVKGNDSEDRVINGLETAENYREFFTGALIISDENVASIGRLPEIVTTEEFDVNI